MEKDLRFAYKETQVHPELSVLSLAHGLGALFY